MYNYFFFKENQCKRKSTRYIGLNLTIPLFSTRTLQVNIFKIHGKNRLIEKI